jgi:N-acetyltransferase 10
MGYGARALDLLKDYYDGKFSNVLSENDMQEDDQGLKRVSEEELQSVNLKSDTVAVRDAKSMPPLLLRLSEKRAPRLHWLGVSYGLTPLLHKFWKKSGFFPLYVRQTANELTGEHTCVMLKALTGVESGYSQDWLKIFVSDFKRRFISLLSFQFKDFPSVLALSLLAASDADKVDDPASQLAEPRNPYELVQSSFTPYDIKRLESYANNMVDYHLIMDLLPTIAAHYFRGKLDHGSKSANGHDDEKKVNLSGVQSLMLIGLGLQRKRIEEIEKEVNLPTSQLLALFTRIIRKVVTFYKHALETHEVQAFEESRKTHSGDSQQKRDVDNEDTWAPLETAMNTAKDVLDDELEEAGDEAMKQLKERQRELIQSLDLSKYAIKGSDNDWNSVEKQVTSQPASTKSNKIVSVSKRAHRDEDASKENKAGKGDKRFKVDALSQVVKEAKKVTGLSSSKKKGGKRHVKQ